MLLSHFLAFSGNVLIQSDPFLAFALRDILEMVSIVQTLTSARIEFSTAAPIFQIAQILLEAIFARAKTGSPLMKMEQYVSI